MIELIPAIDLIDGKCVRLSQGDFARQTTYGDDPLEVARRFDAAGLKRLHMVDLDGAKSGTPRNLRVLETIAANTTFVIDFGGGIKTDRDIRSVFDAGAKIASVGSVAVKDPELLFHWLESYGNERFLLGADVKNDKIAINGWQTSTDTEILAFLDRYFTKGVSKVFVTDIAKDGLLEGPSIELYKRILRRVPELKLIASGGVRSLEDILELDKVGCSGVIVGKALYEETIRLEDLVEFIENAGEKNNSLS